MFFAEIEDVFFIKRVKGKSCEGTYFRSIFGTESYEAVTEFIEWLTDEEFDITRVPEYIEKVKEMGYEYVLCPSQCKLYFGDADSVLTDSMADDAKVVVLFEEDCEQVCHIDVGKFTMYKLINDKEGHVEDSVMYVTDFKDLKDIESYMLNAF